MKMWPSNVRKSDLRIEYYRGSGAGGQNRNKRDTACRITHKETGLSACAQEHNSQDLNRKAAFKRLAAKLVPLMKEALRSELPGVEAGRVRTYHEPRQVVKDDRVKDKTWSYKDVLEGKGLDEIIKEVKSADV